VPLRHLTRPLQYLKGVGPRRGEDLKRAGLKTVGDLLSRLPFRYEDRSQMQPIASIRPGMRAAVLGEVKSAKLSRTRRRGFTVFRAVVGDESGAIHCVWMNRAYLDDLLVPRVVLVLFGEVKLDANGLHFLNPEFELAVEGVKGLHTGRIVPVYERTGLVTPNMHRRLVRDSLDRLPRTIVDPLPLLLLARLGLPDRRTALHDAHFPPPKSDFEKVNSFRSPAQRRLIFEEFFLFQLGHAWRRHNSQVESKARVPIVDNRVRASAARVLPFKLTAGQRTAVREIVDDMQRANPMNRLLQGDVGAGKTIVALLAAMVAMENGLQVAFMAPTEILAVQHFKSLTARLSSSKFRVGLLIGNTTAVERKAIRADVARGTTHLVVGTHALVQDGIDFHRLGLVVIDEQHRFGVAQRAALWAKGLHPDVLLMTATPIPRTLALTDYSELDVSKIVGLPPGRQPIRTTLVSNSDRTDVYSLVRKEIARGRQAYVVYPLVEDSEKVDLRSASEMAVHLADEVFVNYEVALLHGRMKQVDKNRTMQAFVDGEIDVLVSTTVVEVGVDVANASVMVIEHAERFGLSQLHQLRGRVGRGVWSSHCVLMYQAPLSDEARQRLRAMAASGDGFVIAERDLELRGPGDFFGTRQSGMPRLCTGDLVRDRDLMEDAHREARSALKEGALAPELEAFVRDEWRERFGLVDVG
jgi:ATP-dependent DNA helicase RecG